MYHAARHTIYGWEIHGPLGRLCGATTQQVAQETCWLLNAYRRLNP